MPTPPTLSLSTMSLAALLGLPAVQSFAVDYTWNGTASDNITNNANWSTPPVLAVGNLVIGAGDRLLYPGAPPNQANSGGGIIVNSGGAYQATPTGWGNVDSNVPVTIAGTGIASGGALVNDGNNPMVLSQLSLSADASITTGNRLRIDEGAVGSLNLNGFILTKNGGSSLDLINAAMTGSAGSRIVVNSGRFSIEGTSTVDANVTIELTSAGHGQLGGWYGGGVVNAKIITTESTISSDPGTMGRTWAGGITFGSWNDVNSSIVDRGPNSGTNAPIGGNIYDEYHVLTGALTGSEFAKTSNGSLVVRGNAGTALTNGIQARDGLLILEGDNSGLGGTIASTNPGVYGGVNGGNVGGTGTVGASLRLQGGTISPGSHVLTANGYDKAQPLAGTLATNGGVQLTVGTTEGGGVPTAGTLIYNMGAPGSNITAPSASQGTGDHITAVGDLLIENTAQNIKIVAGSGFDSAGGIHTLIDAANITGGGSVNNLSITSGAPVNHAYVLTTHAATGTLNLVTAAHAEASLAAGSNVDSGSANFGTLAEGYTAPGASSVSIFSFDQMDAAVIGLNLDAVTAANFTGDLSAFTYNVSAGVSNVADGSIAETFNVSLVSGLAPGTYTLNLLIPGSKFSDAGAAFLAELAGSGHSSGALSGADTTGATQSGDISYTWSATVVPVPEPGAAALALLSLLGATRRRRAS
jgi:hypothetical protein